MESEPCAGAGARFVSPPPATDALHEDQKHRDAFQIAEDRARMSETPNPAFRTRSIACTPLHHVKEPEGRAQTSDQTSLPPRKPFPSSSQLPPAAGRRSPRPQRRRRKPAGGAERVRTDDLLLAKQALSQLSYSPEARTRQDQIGRSRPDPGLPAPHPSTPDGWAWA